MENYKTDSTSNRISRFYWICKKNIYNKFYAVYMIKKVS